MKFLNRKCGLQKVVSNLAMDTSDEWIRSRVPDGHTVMCGGRDNQLWW